MLSRVAWLFYGDNIDIEAFQRLNMIDRHIIQNIPAIVI